MSKSPFKLWAIKDNQNTAHARQNPITNDWTLFDISDGQSSEGVTIPNDDGLAYLKTVDLMRAKGRVVRDDSTVDLKKEVAKYRHLSFGQFILGIAADAGMSANALMAALINSKENLGVVPDKLYEMWLDSMGAKGSDPRYWTQDVERVFWDAVNNGDKLIRELGEVPNDDDLLEMFNSVVLNLAYSAAANKSSRAFIQKSIGIGFLGRVFS